MNLSIKHRLKHQPFSRLPVQGLLLAMVIIQEDDKVLLIGSQHVYRVDVLNKTVKCIYDGPA